MSEVWTPLSFTVFPARKDAFVHADPVIGKIVIGPQPLLDVICVQDGSFACPLEPLGPEGSDIGISLDHDVEISIERPDPSDGVGTVVIPLIALSSFYDNRDGKEFHEFSGNAYRPASRPAASMGRGEGLVRLSWITSNPRSPGLVFPIKALALAPSQ